MELSTPSVVKARLPLKRKPWQLGRRFIARSISIAFGLAIWEILTGWIYPSILIPSLFHVLIKGYELLASGEILVHIGISLFRILAGFLIGSLIAAPLGLLMGSLRPVRDALDPYVQFFRFVPSIAWLTPAVIWFGIGELSKVTIIVYTTVFIVAINTMVGVSNVAPNKIWAALTLGATRKQVFIYVVLPASLPFILTGMRLAMGNSFATVVSAEMISSEQGLGYLIFNSRLWMATDVIFLSILLLGILGLGTDLLFRRLIRRFAHQFGPIE